MDILNNGNIIGKIDRQSYLIDIKTPTSIDVIMTKFKQAGINVLDIFSIDKETFDVGQVEIANLNGLMLFVYKKDRDYYIALKDKNIWSFEVKHKSKKYSLFCDNEEIKDLAIVKDFVDKLADLKREYPSILLYDLYSLYDDTNLINEFNYRTVISDEEIVLMLPSFRDMDDSWKHLSIVLRKTKEDVGYIEFNLSQDNFKYVGNVEYYIKEEYRRKGYATRALALVKKVVAEYKREVDKILYISTELDNHFSQKVIENNGGSVFYEGEVPKGEKANFLNKVDYVKIYTIAAESIQE